MRRLIPYLIVWSLGSARAETLEDAVRVLGRRVLDKLSVQERVVLQTRFLAPVLARERDRVDRSLREVLNRQAGAPAAAQLRVTVSAGMAHRVLVAEFSRGEEFAILMAEYDPAAEVPRAVQPHPRLERALLWEQDERILDAAAGPGSRGEFWVLDTERLSLRDRQGEVLRQTRVRRADSPWPRDVRGKLSFADGEARALLPGGQSGWPIAASFEAQPAGPNEFSSNGGKDRFFTAARVSANALVLAGADGKMRWSEAGAVRELEGPWGSEVTALANPCGSGLPLVLMSGRDGQSIGMFEPAARALRALGEGMILPGTLSALWPSEGDESATAVVRTPAGRYAAYRIFAGCGR